MEKRPFSVNHSVFIRSDSHEIPGLTIPGFKKIKSPRRTTNSKKSSLSLSKTSKTRSKSKLDYHCINSRIGALRIPNKTRKEAEVVERKVNCQVSEECEEAEEEEQSPVAVFATFSLLKTIDPDSIITCISQIPIFLRTLDIDGKLDHSIVTSVSMSLSSDEIGLFVRNMTNEINYFNGVNNCKTTKEVEETIKTLIPIQKAYVWIKAENSDFIFNDTLNELLPVKKSIIGYCLLNNDDIVTEDPGDHKGFYLDNDLTLLRGVKSMVLLPIRDVNDNVVAVLQCCGLCDQFGGEQISFSNYFVETLKIMRNIIQKQIFIKYRDSTLPCVFAKMFNDVDLSTVDLAIKTISKFIAKQIPCEAADFYTFDDRNKKMTCLNDGSVYDSETGGIAYQAGITKELINVPHGANNQFFKQEIDGKYVNRSIIAKSFFMSREHYVIALRARWNLPVFIDDDIYFMTSTAKTLFDLIHVASCAEDKARTLSSVKKQAMLIHAAYNAMSNYAANGTDPWLTVPLACEEFFGTRTFFITVFDGRNMYFFPAGVKWPFDACLAGTAYNYRELTYAKEGDEIFSKELYEKLGVNANKSVAFPFRRNGKVAGAIEVVNQRVESVDDEMAKMFGNLCANVFEKILLKNPNSL